MTSLCSRRNILILIFVSVVGTYAFFMAFMNYESHPSRTQMTRGAMQGLLIALYNYNARFNAMPEMEMPSVVMALSGGNPSKAELLDISPLKMKWGFSVKTFEIVDTKMNRLDAWGHPMKLEYDSQKQELTIRSFGENCNDDHGGGDDIALSAKFP